MKANLLFSALAVAFVFGGMNVAQAMENPADSSASTTQASASAVPAASDVDSMVQMTAQYCSKKASRVSSAHRSAVLNRCLERACLKAEDLAEDQETRLLNLGQVNQVDISGMLSADLGSNDHSNQCDIRSHLQDDNGNLMSRGEELKAKMSTWISRGQSLKNDADQLSSQNN